MSDKILSLINDNTICQIMSFNSRIFEIAKLLADTKKRVFICVPDSVQILLLVKGLQSHCPKIIIGYANQDVVDYNMSTQVVYITSSYMKRKLLGHLSRRQLFGFTDTIIVDQFDKNNIDNTAIVSLWSYVRKCEHDVPKLVLLTSTPYTFPEKIEQLTIQTQLFSVTLIYDGYNEDVYDRAFDIATFKHNQKSVKGNIIIYTACETDNIKLSNRLKNNILNADIISIYPNSQEFDRVYASSLYRKIIVINNIEEFPHAGIAIIIDTMRKLPNKTDDVVRVHKFDKKLFITKTAANRRTNILGQTRAGICYRLISEHHYEQLDNDNVVHNDVHNLVLDFLRARVDPTKSIIGVAPSVITESIDLLQHLDMIKYVDDEYVIMPCGFFAPRLPLDIRTASFIWRWIQGGHPVYSGIVLASIINVHNGGYFYIPRKQHDMTSQDYNVFCNNYITNTFSDWIGETPLHTYLNMWNSFTSSLNHLHYRLIDNPATLNFYRWVCDNSVNYQQLLELIMTIAKTYRVVRNDIRNIDVNVSIFDINEVMKNAIPILIDIYKDDVIDIRHGEIIQPKPDIQYMFDSRSLILKKFDNCRIISLVTRQITTRINNKINYIDIFIPLVMSMPDDKTSPDDLDDNKILINNKIKQINRMNQVKYCNKTIESRIKSNIKNIIDINNKSLTKSMDNGFTVKTYNRKTINNEKKSYKVDKIKPWAKNVTQ